MHAPWEHRICLFNYMKLVLKRGSYCALITFIYNLFSVRDTLSYIDPVACWICSRIEVVFPVFTVFISCTQSFLYFWIISMCRRQAALQRNVLTSELSHANHSSPLPAPTEGMLSPDHKPLCRHSMLHFLGIYFQESFAFAIKHWLWG